jgi:excisionase family DNA binding protein
MTLTEPCQLITVKEVASLFSCSPRTVYRLADGGQMPKGLKIGGLVRWERAAIETWIAGGCKASRN